MEEKDDTIPWDEMAIRMVKRGCFNAATVCIMKMQAMEKEGLDLTKYLRYAKDWEEDRDANS